MNDNQPASPELVPGIEATEASPMDYLDALHGRLKLAVPRVVGEKSVQPCGTVPQEWSIE